LILSVLMTVAATRFDKVCPPKQDAQGFTQSHGMLLPGKYFCHITQAGTMVINVGAVQSPLQDATFN
jgi:hypothetical protein